MSEFDFYLAPEDAQFLHELSGRMERQCHLRPLKRLANNLLEGLVSCNTYTLAYREEIRRAEQPAVMPIESE